MADDLDDDLEEGEDEDDGEGSSAKGSKKMLFIIIGAVVVLIIGGGAGAWFTGLLDPVVAMITGEEAHVEAEGDHGPVGPEGAIAGEVVFLDLPEILVNLNTGGRKSSYLKIRVSLELPNPADIPRVEGLMPRIMDTFNIYLRELRIDDLKGSTGMYRLREELLMRVGAAVAPSKVNDILFKEMLIQ
mgnify:CR=1 FL=1